MAMIGATAETGRLAGSEPWAVVVKNTFITVAGEEEKEEVSAGRPASLPPSFRLFGRRSGIASPGAGEDGMASSPASGCQQRGRRSRSSAKAMREEDDSTEAGSLPAEEDASTEAGTTVGEEPSSVDAEAVLELEPLGTLHPAPVKGPTKPVIALAEVFGGPAMTQGTGTRRLNSAAQAWTPSAALTAAPSESGRRFHLQLERIIQAARSILLGCACVACVEPTRAACGWTVAVHIPKEKFHLKELALTRAKEAFLMAAEASENVYVLGYMARPFVTSLVGFSARFAAVQDDHKACWGLLKTGFCQFGCNCRWQHPECQATVSVLALLASDTA